MFDVVSLLDGQPNEYISEALEDTQIIQVPLQDVKKMILNISRQIVMRYLLIVILILSLLQLNIILMLN